MSKTLIPVILILVAGLVGFFLIKPVYEKISIAKEGIQGIDDAMEKTKKIGSIVETLRSDMDSITSEEEDKLMAILPKEVDKIRFLNMLNSLALRNNLPIVNLTVSGDTTRNETTVAGTDLRQPKAITASFSVIASYDAFITFLKEIEQSLTLLDVDSISFSVFEDDLDEGYTYTVNLSTYWL